MGLFEISSSWIIALGKTLLHSLWAGFFVFTAVRMLLQWTENSRPLARYRLAFLSQVILATGFIITFLALYRPVSAGHADGIQLHFPYPVLAGRLHDPSRIGLFYYYSTLLYLAGITVSLISTLIGLTRLRKIRKQARPVQGIWKERFSDLVYRTGIRKEVQLLSSAYARAPFLTGLLKPVIIVPAGMFTQLPFAQVEVILLHELHHLKRGDHLAVIIQRVISIVFFYHPAIKALASIAEKERELCCDDHVVSHHGKPLEYARALCHLADRMQGFNSEPVSAATGNQNGHLKYRIQRILNQETMKANIKERLSAIALFTLALAFVLIMSGFSAGLSITRYKQLPAITAEGDQRMADTPARPEAPAAVADPEQYVPLLTYPEIPVIPPSNPTPATEPAEVASRPSLPSGLISDSTLPDSEAMKKSLEEARKALEEIDWEAIHKEIEASKAKALDEIDWEAMHKEVEEALKRAREEMDWESLHKQMEAARNSMKDIDWEAMHSQMEEAWKSMDAIDWDEIQNEFSKAWEQMDWEEMHKAMDGIHMDLDSMMLNFRFDPDFDFDFDFNIETDQEVEVENDLDI